MRKEDYFATFILMVGLLAATLSGFLRHTSLADLLGTGQGADIYLIAYSVPEFIIIALGIILPAAFIPLFVDYLKRFGEVAAWNFGVRVAGSLGFALLIVSFLAAIAALYYLRLLAPGFSVIELSQTMRAARIMMPAIVLMGSAIIIGAALQAFRRFESIALTNFVYNITFVIVVLGGSITWLVGRTAMGVLLGSAAALILQLPFLWKHRGSLRIWNAIKQTSSRYSRSLSVRHFALLAGPLLIGYLIHHIIWFVDRAMATTLGVGSVATLNYAYRLALVIGQLSGLAVSTAIFPRLSEQASAEDNSGLQSSLTDSLRFVWVIGLPATCAMIILRGPLVEVLYEHGAFSRESTIAVSGVLIWYAIAVLADAMCQPLWRIIYAWRSVVTVSVVNGIQTIVRILFNIMLIQSFGIRGIAFSAVIGFLLQVVILSWLVQRRLGIEFVLNWWQEARFAALASIVVSIAVWLLANQILSASAFITLLVSGALGCLLYLVVFGYLRNWRKYRSGLNAN